MKKVVIGIVGLFSVLQGAAQQMPHYSQYVLNQYILNPAITGIENYIDIKASHRHQWVGIDDAPITSYFTIHMPLGKSDFRTTATSYAMEGENPRGSAYWENYTAAEPHHGIGLQVINDRTGPITHLSAYVTYAYHLGLSAKTNLSAGFGVGLKRLSLNANKLNFNVPIDPAVYGSGELNRTKPDLNVGLYLYSSKFFVGVSAYQLIPSKMDFSNNAVKTQDNELVPHFFGTAGIRFLVGEDFNLTPSVLVKYLTGLPVQFDLNAKLMYRDVAWVGTGYRLDDGYMAMAGLNISNKVNLSYSHDFTTSRLNAYSKATHEILVGFVLGNGYGDTCPRSVW